MTETVVLDPSAVATGRTQLDITSFVRAEGINWGDAEFAAIMSQQGSVGDLAVDGRLPNRKISIPLSLRTVGATAYDTIRGSLQQKVALFQRQGGWILRQVGGVSLYADVVNATLHFGGSWFQANRSFDIDAVLQLECVPDWYGDEVTLPDHVETTKSYLNFTEGGTITGNYPGRFRIVVDNDQAVDQHGLLWGLRSTHYDVAGAAALAYEAEALTPLNGAAGAALSGASGGTVVNMGSLPASTWVPFLQTNIAAGNQPLVHTGSYRVWARAYSVSGAPKVRFVWGVGSLSNPVTNPPAAVAGTAAYYLLDLGEVRLDAPPVGSMKWGGVLQAYSAASSVDVQVDQLLFQPLDDGAGRLAYSKVPPSSSITATQGAGSGADDSSTGGAVAWTTPGNITAQDSQYASADLSGGLSHYLKATNFGFGIPSTATIKGIAANIRRVPYGNGPTDSRISLIKAGAIQTVDKANTGALWPQSLVVATYGGSTDLWGGTWTASDINNSGFGVALAVSSKLSSGGIALVDYVSITVYYTLASGFTAAQDAVIWASQTAELRTDGMYRTDGTAYGPISSVIGDLPRVIPSGLEARPLEVFLKASRGNFDDEADSGIDDISARLYYRPSYLFVPE